MYYSLEVTCTKLIIIQNTKQNSSWTAPTHTLRFCKFQKGIIQISHATALEDRWVALVTTSSQALFESARQGRKC